MELNFLETLQKTLKVLSLNEKLTVDNSLVSFSHGKILTPVGDVFPLLTQRKSSLKNQFVSFDSISNFIDILSRNNTVIRLNHIGFCYKVGSQQSEKQRLVNLIKKSTEHLCVEPSNDEGDWFFLGDSKDWQRMMVELIPVEKTKDKWKNYWLPHVQIDIDTSLTKTEIVDCAKAAFGDSVTPFPIEIDGTVYMVRNRLGIVEGVNIMLDIATNSRNVKYQRQTLLKRVDQ